jgi:site-specific DNA-methyltransferase (adenine-specific)
MKIDLYNSECLEKLKSLPDDSIDAVVTDPPYGLSFMGKKWDYDVPSVAIWEECLRVLKPGGYVLAFSSSRTYHRMAVRVEDAGFEIRDQLMWIYGSGFPKSHNIGKAIDKLKGKERKVVGKNPNHRTTTGLLKLGFQDGKASSTITKGSSEWEGWGSALKPAHEPIVMARKPLSEKSLAENVLKWGTGGINIDACRIGSEILTHKGAGKSNIGAVGGSFENGTKEGLVFTSEGRFPANIILDEEAGKILDEQSGTTKTKADLNYKHNKTNSDSEIFKSRGTYTPRADEGGASRFFYCAKVSTKERNKGCDDLEKKDKAGKGFRPNHGVKAELGEDGNPYGRWGKIANNHPTVKPIALMEYLIKLVSKEEATILDPFMGSGSTGIAAKKLNRSFVGIEMDEGYYTIASKRIGK